MQIRRRTLGLLIGSTEDSYGNGLLRGVLEVTREAGASLVCFTSGTIRSYHGFEAQKNVLYDLVSAQTVDGIIISGSLGHNVSQDELVAFCKRFAPLPLISLSVELPGIHSVVTENQSGMEDLMAHLLDDHGYTRLAWIGGPVGQQEAEIRQSVFTGQLRKRGIPVEEAWMTNGDYTRDSGKNAAWRLLAKGKPQFQGVVCANDSMAMGAMEVFESQGYHCPDDYFLTGFDDMDESQFSRPPLTTVRQSSFQQAKESARVLLRLLDGDPVPLKNNLPPTFVIRQSCGCQSFMRQTPHPQVDNPLSPERQYPSLMAAFQSAESTGNSGPLIAELESLLDFSLSRDQGSVLQEALTEIRDRRLNEVGDNTAARYLIESLVHYCRIFISAANHRNESKLRFRSEAINERLRETGEALLTSYNLANVLDTLSIDLPRMGFNGFWLSLFEDPKNPNSWARLQLGYHNGKRQELPAEGQKFPSRELVPGGLKAIEGKDNLYVLEALYSKDERLGFILFATELPGTMVCGSLRSHISGALQGVLLLEERRKAESQLVQSEKMAALGNLVAGVAHEINTPLGVAITAASYLGDLNHDFTKLSQGGQLTKSALDNFLKDNNEAAGLILANLHRAAELVASFKQVAVDQTSELRRRFFLREYIEDTFMSLRPQWKKHKVEVTVQGPMKLEIDSYPGAVAQITTNLLMNALLHAFEPGRTDGRINLILEDFGDSVLYRFTDNGQGIQPENLARIFEPFFTTKRGQGGTGLGLHIIFNLVHKLLGGRINCASNPGEGTVFSIILPKKAPLNS